MSGRQTGFWAWDENRPITCVNDDNFEGSDIIGRWMLDGLGPQVISSWTWLKLHRRLSPLWRFVVTSNMKGWLRPKPAKAKKEMQRLTLQKINRSILHDRLLDQNFVKVLCTTYVCSCVVGLQLFGLFAILYYFH